MFSPVMVVAHMEISSARAIFRSVSPIQFLTISNCLLRSFLKYDIMAT